MQNKFLVLLYPNGTNSPSLWNLGAYTFPTGESTWRPTVFATVDSVDQRVLRTGSRTPWHFFGGSFQLQASCLDDAVHQSDGSLLVIRSPLKRHHELCVLSNCADSK